MPSIKALNQAEYRAAKLYVVLKALVVECRAIEALSADAIKDSAGYTNLQVWRRKIDAAQELMEESRK